MALDVDLTLISSRGWCPEMGRSRSLPELGRIVGPGVASGLPGLMRLSNLIIKQSQEQSSYVQQSSTLHFISTSRHLD